MNPYVAKWKEIKGLLSEACDDLPSGEKSRDPAPAPVGLLTGNLEEFQEFLDHNELELAWDALAAVAEQVHAPAACWQKLARAAGLMELPAKKEEAEYHALGHGGPISQDEKEESP